MPVFTSLADIAILVETRREELNINKSCNYTSTVGAFYSAWIGFSSGVTFAGAIPTTPAVPTKATQGGLGWFSNPSVGETAHVYRFEVKSPGGLNAAFLYDRLSHMGGLSGIVTTAQAVNTAALTRGDTTGKGVEAFIEWYVNTGSTAVTATVSYTNSAGVAGQIATVAIAASQRAGRLLQIPPVAGDDGIRSIQSITLSATTGTAGNFGITLGRRIALACPPKEGEIVSLVGLECGLPKIEPDACLWLLSFCTSFGSFPLAGSLTIFTTG